MMRNLPWRQNRMTLVFFTLVFTIFIAGCGQKSEENATSSSGKSVIQNCGSDTMVNLAQAWAEEYAKSMKMRTYMHCILFIAYDLVDQGMF